MWEESLLRNKTFNEYFCFLPNSITNKNSIASTDARNEGNKLWNKKHTDGIHKKILHFYSKSIAFAPKESEELVLGISNRSCLLKHLGKYNECISDINYALSFNKASDILKSKLFCRKIFCLSKLGMTSEAQTLFNEAKILIQNKINNENLKEKTKIMQDLNNSINVKSEITNKPSNNSSDPCYKIISTKDLPYISDAITMKFNKTHKRHIVANRNIKTGEIILVENSYCAHPDLRELYNTCSHCLKQNWISIPCENCVFAMYCSNQCKINAFKEYHDIECQIYPYLFTDKYNLNHFFLSRLFIKVVKENGLDSIIQIATSPDDEKFDRNMEVSNKFLKDNNKSFEFYYNFLICGEIKNINNPIMEINKKFPLFLLNTLKNVDYFNTNKNFEKSIPSLNNLLQKLFWISDINGFGFEILESQQPIPTLDGDHHSIYQRGTFLNGIASLFNHHCFSNVDSVHLPGPKVVYYAETPIKKNEQLCCSYGPILDSKVSDRQLYLKQKFNFICDCRGCTENWPSFEDVRSLIKKIPQEKMLNIYLQIESNNLNYIVSKPFNQWTLEKKTLQDVCKFVDVNFSNLSIFEAAMCTFGTAGFLKKIFHTVYSGEVEIPNACSN